MASIKKDQGKILKEARKQGWRVKDVGRRFKAFSPDGVTMVTVSKTPSSQRAIKELIAELRRGGFKWKGR